MDNKGHSIYNIESIHPEPVLTKEIQDPTDSICLCQLGLQLKPETSDTPGTLMLYIRESDPKSLAQQLVGDPIWQALRGTKSEFPEAWTDGRVIPETGSPPVKSSNRIHGAQKLWLLKAPFYDCRPPHGLHRLREPLEITEVSSRCPKEGCGGALRALPMVIDEDPSSWGEDSSEPWAIWLRNASD